MYRLTAAELDLLGQAWAELWRISPGGKPPETDDEVTAAGLDSIVAGIMSSEGFIDAAALEEAWGNAIPQRINSIALNDLVSRLAEILHPMRDD